MDKELDQASLTYNAMQLIFALTGKENLDPNQAIINGAESVKPEAMQRFQALEDAVTTALFNYMIMTGRVQGIKRVVARDVTEYDPLHQYDVISNALDELLLAMGFREIALPKSDVQSALNNYFQSQLRSGAKRD